MRVTALTASTLTSSSPTLLACRRLRVVSRHFPSRSLPFSPSFLLPRGMASSTTSPANPSGLSDACCDPGAGALSGRPTHLTGKEVTIAGIPCYSVGDTGGPCDVVIVATDVFGWRFDNNRVVADEVAAGGFHVVIPDLFEGDSVTMEQLKGGRAYIRGVWWPKHMQEKTAPFLAQVAAQLKKEGRVKSVFSLGHCYGAPGALHLVKEGLAKSAVVAHPSGFTKDNVDSVAGPTLFLCAEVDESFPPEVRQLWEAKLQEKGVPARFVDFPGTVHGFAVRDDGTPHGVAERQRATQETISFLQMQR